MKIKWDNMYALERHGIDPVEIDKKALGYIIERDELSDIEMYIFWAIFSGSLSLLAYTYLETEYSLFSNIRSRLDLMYIRFKKLMREILPDELYKALFERPKKIELPEMPDDDYRVVLMYFGYPQDVVEDMTRDELKEAYSIIAESRGWEYPITKQILLMGGKPGMYIIPGEYRPIKFELSDIRSAYKDSPKRQIRALENWTRGELILAAETIGIPYNVAKKYSNDELIARIVGVPVDFVKKVKRGLIW